MSLALEMAATLANRRPDLAAELRAIHAQCGPEASAWQKRANANFARLVSECEVIELQEPNMANQPVPVNVQVSDLQLSALGKLLHNEPIDTDERCELLNLHIHMGAQVLEHREAVERLLHGMGADGLREASERVAL